MRRNLEVPWDYRDFSPFAAVLLDLDGTIFHEEEVLPGAVELVRRLQKEGRNFACLSNSTTSPQRRRRRLTRMGLDVPVRRIYGVRGGGGLCDGGFWGGVPRNTGRRNTASKLAGYTKKRGETARF